MEFVYVVPREELFPDHYPQGLVPFGEGFVREQFEERILDKGFFVERDYAERTPSLKQIIPYCCIVSKGRVLLLKRTKGGGESRLHDKLSIGVGGHINPVDAVDGDPIRSATRREIEEEIHIGEYERRVIGLINDDSNPVGAVHLGIAQVVSTVSPVGIKEEDQLEGNLVDLDHLANELKKSTRLETWSRLFVRILPAALQTPDGPLPAQQFSQSGVGS